MIDKTRVTKNGIKIIDTTKATNALFDILQTQFPQTIKDGQVDLKSIANLLGLNTNAINRSGYELTFTGKGLANALYNTPCEKVPKLKESFTPTNTTPQTPRLRGGASHISPSLAEGDKGGGFDSTKNAIIIGDNLDALKILKSAYTEKIKMIYIDPPYNTANDNFIYPDNFREDYKAILREVGLIEIDENGEETESENLRFFKNIQSSRTHSGWLSFMLPRLKLARDLLKDDGVIFISIDDNEQANLKILCDEIFGEDNYIETFLWNKTQTPPSASNKTRKTHEFILCYQKYKDNQKMIARFSDGGDAPLWNETNSERILTFPENYVFSNLKNGFYEKGIKDKIELLDNVEVYNGKIVNSFRLKGHFRWKQETLNEEINNNVFLVVKSDKFSIRYCREGERVVMPTNEISKKDNVGTNETASNELLKLFDNNKVFSFNKPVSLIKYLITMCSNDYLQADSNDIILDFFAGSGTTAHAVMELNAEDNGNRQCILVQLDEKIDSVKSKVAYDFCKNEIKSDKPTISDITAERVRRASVKIATKLTKENMDLGFKLYSLESKSKLISDEKGVLRLMTNANLSPSDKALNLALQSGKTLDKPIEIVIKNKLYKCDDSYFCVECDEIVLKALSQTSDEYIYIDAYSDINLEHFLNLDARFKERLNVVY